MSAPLFPSVGDVRTERGDACLRIKNFGRLDEAVEGRRDDRSIEVGFVVARDE